MKIWALSNSSSTVGINGGPYLPCASIAWAKPEPAKKTTLKISSRSLLRLALVEVPLYKASSIVIFHSVNSIGAPVS